MSYLYAYLYGRRCGRSVLNAIRFAINTVHARRERAAQSEI